MGKPIGFIFFSSFKKNTYSDAHINLFLPIANQLSSIIEKSRIHEELHRAHAELARSKERLEWLASHDPLTGVSNRRTFRDLLHREWKRAIRNGTAISLIMIDVDFFKPNLK